MSISAATTAILERINNHPTVGVILGSGLGALADQVRNAVRIPYGEIPGWPVSTVQGHAGELVLGQLNDVQVAVMSGRIHYYEGHDPKVVTLPVRVLQALGVSKLIVTNAAGGVNPNFGPGSLMVITDHINLTGTNPLRGPNDDVEGPRFPDMSEAYCEAGRSALRVAAAQVGVNLVEGVYCGVSGPSYETPAEIRMMQTLGADAVGMSTVPEVIVANHAGLEVAGLSLITNAAAGLSEEKLSHDDVKRVASTARDEVVALLAAAIPVFGGS